jgi:adenosylcobinamide-GDP ribazoletransferase
MGETVAATAAPPARDLLGWGLLLALTAVGVPALIAFPLLVLGVATWFRRTLGGLTGDAHGAGIEIVETGLLVALAVAGALA